MNDQLIEQFKVIANALSVYKESEDLLRRRRKIIDAVAGSLIGALVIGLTASFLSSIEHKARVEAELQSIRTELVNINQKTDKINETQSGLLQRVSTIEGKLNK